jgi:mRNA interferase HigB
MFLILARDPRADLTTSQLVKLYRNVHIVTRKHLNEAREAYPDAATEIEAWVAIAKEVRWHNFPEVRGTFKDADNVKGYVIFNIWQNRYRLVTVIHYAKTTKERRAQGHVYIRLLRNDSDKAVRAMFRVPEHRFFVLGRRIRVVAV